MNNAELKATLQLLWQQGIELWLENEQLRFRANKSAMTAENTSLLKKHKTAIIQLLGKEPELFTGYPLSHGQRAIHLMQNMAPESYAYNQSCLLRLNNDIVPNQLKLSVEQLIEHQTALKTGFKISHQGLAQYPAFSMPEIWRSEAQAINDDEQLQQWFAKKADTPFQLEHDALIRITLLNNTIDGSYFLLVVAHHIIADFWTMELILDELQQFYEHQINNTSTSLKKLEKTYKDYVISEHQWLHSEEGLEAKRHWHKHLTPLPSTLEIPKDFIRPSQQHFQGQEQSFILNKVLTSQIKQQAKAHQVTAFTWVLSAYQALLQRYSGETEITVGSPIAGRTHQALQKLAGHFTNPVSLSADFTHHPSFTELLQSNKKQLKQALKHQAYPFQCLIEELQPPRDANNSPIFQLAISWNQWQEHDFSHSLLVKNVERMEQRGAIYDLVLTAYDKGDEIALSWRYNSDLFKANTVKRFSVHLKKLLELSCLSPEQTIQKYDFRDDGEIQLLNTINNTSAPLPIKQNIAETFHQIALRKPSLCAYKQVINDKLEHKNYRQLDEYSNRIAHYLLEQGVKPGQSVALCINRSFDMLASILATLKTGCIYIPIDPIYPKERIGQILDLSAACLIISHHQHAAKVQFVSDKQLLELDTSQKEIALKPNDFEIYNDGKIAQDDIASILFTSGSTGTPKGVKIPHRAICRLAINNGMFDSNEGDTFCYVSNVSFDATNIEIWASLLNGGNLLYVATDTLLDPEKFSNFINRYKPNTSLITTALFNILVNYKPDIFKTFDTILVGGEASDINTMRLCYENGRPRKLINAYGPTENGTISTYFDMQHLVSTDAAVPIGIPNNNSQVYIHDAYDKICPIGVIGEIMVGGEGVAPGYLNQNKLSHEKFADDFYRGRGLLYATGDLGYMRDDGNIIYAGRKDDQVKIRGYRIELGEVEQQLSLYEHINMCSIAALQDNLGNTYLAAYITSNISINIDKLKHFLHKNLPDFMVPSAFMQLDQLPINANGKVDKRNLPSISFERHHEYVAPRDENEEIMANIWSNLLNVSKVGIFDNFFELGGHSLLAINTANEMRQQLDVEVNMRLIFEHPCIHDLSNALIHNVTHLPQIKSYTADKKSTIQASMSQQRLWFLQQLNPASNAYNMPAALRFKAPVKASHIEFMLQQLINRHPSLRSTLKDNNGVAFIHIEKTEDWNLHSLDFSQLSPQDAEIKAQQQINQLVNQNFDLSTGPLFDALYIQLQQHEHILVLCLHHIISDGWSIELLLQELGLIWSDIKRQLQQPNHCLTVTPLKPISIDYSDFSLWQKQWLQGEVLENQLNYWQQQLEGAPALLNLTTDKTRPAVLSNEGQSFHFSISRKIIAKLETISQDNSATLFMTLMAAYSLLISRYSQQSDVCIGFPISGRNQPELEAVIGLFVNNLVIRSDLSKNPSVNSLIEQVRNTTVNAFAHQDAPFDLVIDRLKLERSLSYTPLLQASFSLEQESIHDKIKKHLGAEVSLEPLDWNIAKYDINLTCFESKDGDMQATIEYSSDLYVKETIARLSEHFVRLLEMMANNPQSPINELQILTPEERNALIEDWQLTAAHNKLTINAVNRFEIQVNKFNYRTAVTFEKLSMDYQTLNLKANQLAHFLQANGITSGDYVGLYLERSIEVVIAILAILKTGAAYIPLDPHAPKDRINFILHDARVKHLITHHDLSDHLDVKNIYHLDSLGDTLMRLPINNLNVYIPNDSTAYVIYTSGTTGKPKGCLISHANLARLFTTTDQQFQFNEDDVWTLFHSYAFDFSVWEIWGALLYGGRLSIIPQWMTRVPDAFYKHLLEEKVTILNQTPSAFSQIISIDQQMHNETLALRNVIFGGEALDFNALQNWIEHHPLEQVRLTNMYGITETTVHASYHEVSEEDIQRGRSIIGKPLNDLIIHILDSHGQHAPTGVLGEMFISGAGVTQGYLNRPELTAERFLENPFIQSLPDSALNAHKRMYRSGDLARRLNNGDIEYLGRIDHQVKIRGHRIELGEIESALSNFSDIKEAIVLAKEEGSHKRLVAYLLVDDVEKIAADTLRHQLRASLPDYMVPAAFVTLTEWPLTANGKVDNIRLPAPQDSHFSSKEYVAPRNDSEQAICLIWSEILGIEKVGIYDNFFELGGHSLLATQVASRIRLHLQCSLELKAIFENPTPAELALVIIEQEINDLEIDDDDLLSLLEEIDD